MKNIFKIVILLLSFSAFAQNEADLPDGVGFPNGTDITTTNATDKVLIFGADNNSNRLISVNGLLVQGLQDLQSVLDVGFHAESLNANHTFDIDLDNASPLFSSHFNNGKPNSSIIRQEFSNIFLGIKVNSSGGGLNIEENGASLITTKNNGTQSFITELQFEEPGESRVYKIPTINSGNNIGNPTYYLTTSVNAILADSEGNIDLPTFPAPYFNTFSHIINQNTTEDVIVPGSFFNPTTTVAIAGQTVNSVTFINDNELLVNVTSGTVNGFYDVTIDNGTATTLTNAFEVKLFTILIPDDGTTLWVRNTSALTTLGKLVPTITGSGWNKGASFGVVPANTDFILEFNPAYMAGQTAGGYAMIGVDNADPNWNYNTIDYSMYLQNGTNLYIYENGGSKGTYGNWTTSDTLAIRRTGTVIEYLKNGNVVYTSATPNSSAMSFDTSLYRYLGAENIKITHE